MQGHNKGGRGGYFNGLAVNENIAQVGRGWDIIKKKYGKERAICPESRVRKGRD